MLLACSLRGSRRQPLLPRRHISWAGHAVPPRRHRLSTTMTPTARLPGAARLARLQLSRSQRPLSGLRRHPVIRVTLTRAHVGLLGGDPGLIRAHLGRLGRRPGANKIGARATRLPAPGQHMRATTPRLAQRTAPAPPTPAGLLQQVGWRWRQALARSRCSSTQFGTRTCCSCLPPCLTQTRHRTPRQGRRRCGMLRALRGPARGRTPGSRAWELTGATPFGATSSCLRTRA